MMTDGSANFVSTVTGGEELVLGCAAFNVAVDRRTDDGFDRIHGRPVSASAAAVVGLSVRPLCQTNALPRAKITHQYHSTHDTLADRLRVHSAAPHRRVMARYLAAETTNAAAWPTTASHFGQCVLHPAPRHGRRVPRAIQETR